MFNHSIVLLMFFCLFASYFVTHCILTEAPVSHIFVASTLCAAGCAARTYMLFAIASSCDQWPGVIRDAGPFSLNAPLLRQHFVNHLTHARIVDILKAVDATSAQPIAP